MFRRRKAPAESELRENDLRRHRANCAAEVRREIEESFAQRETKTLVELHETKEELEGMKHEHEHLVGQIVELTLELEQAQASAADAASRVEEANTTVSELSAERDEWQQRFDAEREAPVAEANLPSIPAGPCRDCEKMRAEMRTVTAAAAAAAAAQKQQQQQQQQGAAAAAAAAAANEAAAAAAAQPHRELLAVQAALERSKAACEARGQEAAKAKALLLWRKGVQQALDKDAQLLQQTTLVLRREVERLHTLAQSTAGTESDGKELATCRAQVQSLQRQLLSTKAHFVSDSRTKEQEHAELRGNTEHLREQLRTLSQRAETDEEQMQRQLVRLQGENERLSYELMLSKEGAVPDGGGPPSPNGQSQQCSVAAAQQELTELRAVLTQCQESEQGALAEADELRHKARKLGNQVDRLQKQIAAEAALERVGADAARSENEQLHAQVSTVLHAPVVEPLPPLLDVPPACTPRDIPFPTHRYTLRTVPPLRPYCHLCSWSKRRCV